VGVRALHSKEFPKSRALIPLFEKENKRNKGAQNESNPVPIKGAFSLAKSSCKKDNLHPFSV
jgi:hypothetical protein